MKKKQSKPFTEREFESLVDKALQPVEPERKPDAINEAIAKAEVK